MMEPGALAAKPAHHWRRYRIATRLILGGVVLYLPAMIVANLTLEALGFGDDAMSYLAFAWLGGVAASGGWLSGFRCPGCGGRFFMWGYGAFTPGSLWGAKCRRCGARAPR